MENNKMRRDAQENTCKDCERFSSLMKNSCTVFECYVPQDDHICGVFLPKLRSDSSVERSG